MDSCTHEEGALPNSQESIVQLQLLLNTVSHLHHLM